MSRLNVKYELINSTQKTIIRLIEGEDLESGEQIKESLRKANCLTAIISREVHYPGYTFHELNVLGAIVRHPGMIARDICGYNVMDPGYLSKILKKMEQNGLILRIVDKRPPFEKTLSVTPLGEKVYSEAELLVDHSIAERLAALDESERAAFSDCITKLLHYLQKIAPDTPAPAADAESSRK